MQTGEKKIDERVPEALALIQDFINTSYRRGKIEAWKSPDHLQAWLVEHQLLSAETPVSQGDQRRMIEVREALRSLLQSNSGMPVVPEQIETLNYASRHAPGVVHFRSDGQAELVPDIAGIDGVTSHLLAIVFTAMTEGSWERLKVCHSERCQKAFYDTSRNHSGVWCDMAKCGSRFKARAYRERQKSRAEAGE